MKRSEGPRPDLSVVIPVWGHEHNLSRLIPSIRSAQAALARRSEVIVSAGPRASGLRDEVTGLGAAFVTAEGSGYGEILWRGLEASSGRYVITMDADFSHRPSYLRTMWMHRDDGEIVIASRYVYRARAEMGMWRRAVSRLLNLLYRKILSLPYRDLSSAFRMYGRAVLEDIGPPSGKGLDVLPEMAAKGFSQGWKVVEVPFWYRAARPWSRARAVRMGLGYLRTMGMLFGLRNSVKSADYDHRAFDSWIPLQRRWQRRRFRIILGFAGDAERILDIGCGSSRIVQALPQMVGMDLAIRKLRWLRAPGRKLVQGDMNRLPFGDARFDAVICSEVIEHIPREEVRLEELARVLRPGGTLVLGTPDYGRRRWRALEWLYGKVFPGGYASEHINRYTNEELRSQLAALGLEVLDCRYVGGSEMIFKARAPLQDRPARPSRVRAASP